MKIDTMLLEGRRRKTLGECVCHILRARTLFELQNLIAHHQVSTVDVATPRVGRSLPVQIFGRRMHFSMIILLSNV